MGPVAALGLLGRLLSLGKKNVRAFNPYISRIILYLLFHFRFTGNGTPETAVHKHQYPETYQSDSSYPQREQKEKKQLECTEHLADHQMHAAHPPWKRTSPA